MLTLTLGLVGGEGPDKLKSRVTLWRTWDAGKGERVEAFVSDTLSGALAMAGDYVREKGEKIENWPGISGIPGSENLF